MNFLSHIMYTQLNECAAALWQLRQQSAIKSKLKHFSTVFVCTYIILLSLLSLSATVLLNNSWRQFCVNRNQYCSENTFLHSFTLVVKIFCCCTVLFLHMHIARIIYNVYALALSHSQKEKAYAARNDKINKTL